MNLDLINDVKEIIKRNEEEINKTGKGFNLISILGMEENERYTHSNIIAELLKANGSHTFGNKFFDLFLKEVNISNFDSSNYEVLTEEYVGSIPCSDGSSLRTFLDIVIKDKNTGQVILIENKIWAEDQPYQIERYYDKYKEKIVKLFYLNVAEWKDCPTNRVEILNVFQNISYETNVKNWLANCIVASSEKSYVNRQIEAYYQTVLKISNQDIYKKMSEELVNIILKNEENFKTAEQISNKINEINSLIFKDFFVKLNDKFKLNDKVNFNDFYLKYSIGEDSSDYLYIGFQFVDSSDRLVTNHSLFNKAIEELASKFPNNEFHIGNNSWNGWFSISSQSLLFRKHFSNLEANQKISLYKNMESEVGVVFQEFSAIFEELKMLIKH
jgi:hypothetical protein